MQSITVRSFAKINWMLRVLEKRADGFHSLETIFQTISLHDLITFTRAPRLEITCDDPAVPVDETNLAWRAAAMMMADLAVEPVRIDLRKAIPAGGGLGGGSSNAAMTLLALDRMFDLQTAPGRLIEIATELGSDVPFFLIGGAAWGTGRGERLEVLPSPPPVHLLLLLPDERIATADAYALLAAARRSGELRTPRSFGKSRAEFIVREGIIDHGADLANDFEGVIFRAHPRLRELKEALFDSGADFALMSGSGSGIFGAFREREIRDAAMPVFAASLRAIPAELVSAHEAMRDLR